MLCYLTSGKLSSFCLRSGTLGDFEGFWVLCLLFLLIEGQGWNQFFNGSSTGAIFPHKIASLCFQTTQQKGRKNRASSRTFWSKIHPKGPELALGKNRSHTVFERSKCMARLMDASQKTSHWFPHFDCVLTWYKLNYQYNNGVFIVFHCF